MKISIIVPIYKGNKYINSILSNIEENVVLLDKRKNTVEVILVNDFPSLPLMYEVKIAKNYKVKEIYNNSNLGIHASRVNGLKASTGDYILFLDQDDSIEANFLQSQIDKIKDADVIIANGYRDYGQKRVKIYGSIIAQLMTKWKIMYLYGTDMILSPGQCLIKRSAIPKLWENCIMDINGCDDFYLWLIMLWNNKKFCINRKKLYHHMETDSNYSNDRRKMVFSYIQACELLNNNSILNKRQIDVLKRRINLRQQIRDEKGRIKKVNLILKNIDIAFITFLYKLSGFY